VGNHLRATLRAILTSVHSGNDNFSLELIERFNNMKERERERKREKVLGRVVRNNCYTRITA